jgi:hypothetical protein
LALRSPHHAAQWGNTIANLVPKNKFEFGDASLHETGIVEERLPGLASQKNIFFRRWT